MDLKEQLISELRNQRDVYKKELESCFDYKRREKLNKKIDWINEMLYNYR